jgi:Ca-activated chloride channel homolog
VRGRHRTAPSPGGRGLRVVAAAVVVLVVLGGSYYAYGKVSKAGCSTPVHLTVAAAPEIAPVVKAQATAWAADAQVNGSCVTVDVSSAESADIAAALADQAKVSLTGVGRANGKTKIPDTWVPDSSAWLLRLRTAKVGTVPNVGVSLAKSPVVLAMPEPFASSLGWPGTKLTYAALLDTITKGGGQLKVGITDPTRDSSGLSGLLAMSAAAQATGAQATENATAALRALAAGSSSVRQEVLQRFPRATDTTTLSSSLAAAPLSEQAVVQYNQGQPPVRLAALYVAPLPNPLDYPYVTLAGATGDRASAAAALGKALTGAAFKDKLAPAGFRGPDGTTGKGFPALTGAPASLPAPAAGATPDGAAIEQLLQAWLTVALPARMLAVLDVSGSMLNKVPTAQNRTREEVLTEAARKGLSLFDDTWAVGLWIFSTELDGPTDYKQLQPIGPLSAQRTQLLQSLATVQPKKNGDTGLYDTILAGYKTVLQGWDDGAVNSLVVMTDGENDDKNGINLDQLLQQLKATVDPQKPISVILIGIGTDVKQADMERITNAVGGGTFLAPDPAKIGEIFLKAISLRTQPK